MAYLLNDDKRQLEEKILTALEDYEKQYKELVAKYGEPMARKKKPSTEKLCEE